MASRSRTLSRFASPTHPVFSTFAPAQERIQTGVSQICFTRRINDYHRGLLFISVDLKPFRDAELFDGIIQGSDNHLSRSFRRAFRGAFRGVCKLRKLPEISGRPGRHELTWTTRNGEQFKFSCYVGRNRFRFIVYPSETARRRWHSNLQELDVIAREVKPLLDSGLRDIYGRALEKKARNEERLRARRSGDRKRLGATRPVQRPFQTIPVHLAFHRLAIPSQSQNALMEFLSAQVSSNPDKVVFMAGQHDRFPNGLVIVNLLLLEETQRTCFEVFRSTCSSIGIIVDGNSDSGRITLLSAEGIPKPIVYYYDRFELDGKRFLKIAPNPADSSSGGVEITERSSVLAAALTPVSSAAQSP